MYLLYVFHNLPSFLASKVCRMLKLLRRVFDYLSSSEAILGLSRHFPCFVSGLSLLSNIIPTTSTLPSPTSEDAPFLLMTQMATFASPSPSRSPTRMPRRWARKCERYCCIGATYFPLVFVYSITSWAVWVEATIGFLPAHTPWIGMSPARLCGLC
jgi:hypothetical protein